MRDVTCERNWGLILGLHVLRKANDIPRFKILSSFPYQARDLASWTISQLTELKVQFLLERCKVFFKVLGNNSHQITFFPGKITPAWNSRYRAWWVTSQSFWRARTSQNLKPVHYFRPRPRFSLPSFRPTK